LRRRDHGDAQEVGWLAIIAAAAALAGCAGEADERLSREELAEQAAAICNRAEERLSALREPEDVADVEGYARDAQAITQEGLDDLRDLEPPEELEEAFARYLEQADEVVALLGELEDAAAAGDEAEARRLSVRIAEAAEARAAARAAGIPACERET
jgi:uncharacterized protein YhdP